MKTKHVPVIAFVIIFIVISRSFGQYQMGQLGWGIYAGMEKFVGGAVDYSTASYFEGLSFKYSFSPLITSEFSISAGWVRPRSQSSHFETMENAPYKTYIYPWDINLRLNFKKSGRIIPYMGGGAGLTYWDLRELSMDDKWFPFPPDGESKTKLQSNISLTALTGFVIFFSDNVGIDIGVKYTHLLDQPFDNIGTSYIGKTPDINNGIISGFITFNVFLSPGKDSDNDGIPDKNDLAPFAKEDFDNFQDQDGAPDLDNDNDGIPDIKDKAPNVPEDIDGFQDDDGVPDLDNDGDGIPDLRDKCPNAPEDFDGFQDDDGCPDTDNDNDGIPDIKDKCPDKPETINGYQDSDGCPDEKPKAVVPEKGTSIILPGINFTFASATLTAPAKMKLDELAAELVKHPEIKLEIRGYTDSIGSAASNLRLSQKRADSVKRYLISRGVIVSQLRAIGFGEANPIASNSTKQGRAKNRRIEFARTE